PGAGVGIQVNNHHRFVPPFSHRCAPPLSSPPSRGRIKEGVFQRSTLYRHSIRLSNIVFTNLLINLVNRRTQRLSFSINPLFLISSRMLGSNNPKLYGVCPLPLG